MFNIKYNDILWRAILKKAHEYAPDYNKLPTKPFPDDRWIMVECGKHGAMDLNFWIDESTGEKIVTLYECVKVGNVFTTRTDFYIRLYCNEWLVSEEHKLQLLEWIKTEKC